KSQKMEAIGTLASGIAHDFNNILTTIIGYTKMSMKDFMAVKNEDKDLSVVRSDLTEVRNAAYRARDLVNHILAFSRHSKKDYSPIQLSSTVKESLKMLRQSLSGKIKIKETLSDQQFILGDPAQIHLVLENLCTNAAYAMDKTGGILEVSVKSVHTDGAATGLEIPAGDYMRLKVKDTGHGMSPQIMTAIFDPYFSTKGRGQGMGLGLSVVHGIVKSHGGFIRCKSVQGKGTTFDIYLPQYEPKAQGHEMETFHTRKDKKILNLDKNPAINETMEKSSGNKGFHSKNREH
ncbi:MAG: hybrid sensor histidine kinase/response regulator, partial [Deltaproteobacteria bacterium]|nr:hybrid sensor histidine kinase/response regulator [Deltaproteobacteria bacterium]